ncbi:VanZ family protein [Simplicispira psychrophila]|uniref:VanZ family protein n=1 Tax=Simplicispira psychrophila TaxID=80882 RepID=UPI0004887450|nr:VanZ family protein [Simplicispira psychrophila]
MTSLHASSKSFRVALGLLCLLIVYGSLYPLTWNFSAPQDFIWCGPIGLMDLIENVILFLPLGALLGWSAQGNTHKGRHFATWFVLALVLASTLQWLQKYLPRTPALSDVLFNLAGYTLGWAAGLASGWRVARLLHRHPQWAEADRFALVLLALWLVAELYPLIPTLDVSSVAHNVKSLWQQNPWQPRRMLLHLGMAVIGLSAVTHLARTAQLALYARPLALLVALAVLAGKFVIVGQSPGMAVVAGIVGGFLLWRWIDTWPAGQRWTAMAGLALFTYVLDALWPWQWRNPPTAMDWMPFASALKTSVQAAITARAFEGLCFGTILWSTTVRHGAGLPGMTFSTALLAFACEWTQRYLPTRTAEITSVLVALAMGWMLSVCMGRVSFQSTASHDAG